MREIQKGERLERRRIESGSKGRKDGEIPITLDTHRLHDIVRRLAFNLRAISYSSPYPPLSVGPLSPLFILAFFPAYVDTTLNGVLSCLSGRGRPFNLRLSIAGFNHRFESINVDDGDKGKDYGADTLSLIAERLDSNSMVRF